MRRPESHFNNHPGLRSGIFYFLLVLSLLQGVKWLVSRGFQGVENSSSISQDPLTEARLDSIRLHLRAQGSWTMRSLDPNYLEDYKGYLLGIPFAALDSVYAFKSKGGNLFEMDQFQRITGLSDSACARLTPFFRFPKLAGPKKSRTGSGVRDLNTATAEQLQTVRGIGPVLSERIVKFREALGGFLAASQLEDVYGLSPEVASRVHKAFPLHSIPSVEKVNLNRASAEELSEILYLTRQMARDIVAYRDRVGAFGSLNDLRQLQSLPADKIDRIALYLQL